jgi:predicted Zn-dependent protease
MFERIAATEQRHPGAVSQLFNTHPLTLERIAKTQKNIQQNLPARAEYVVNTSEYEDVRARLVGLQERRKAVVEKAPPTLMIKAGESKDERPTLKKPE